MNAKQLSQRIWSELCELVSTGVIPETVGSFSELHDYVDANCLGGADDLLGEYSLDEMHSLMNSAHQSVDAAIKSGALKGLSTVTVYKWAEPMSDHEKWERYTLSDDRGDRGLFCYVEIGPVVLPKLSVYRVDDLVACSSQP